MLGKKELQGYIDIGKMNIPEEEILCGHCANFPNNPEVCSDILCPFRTIVTEFTSSKSLNCQYATKRKKIL